MKRLNYIVIFLISMLVITSSCNKRKTYADLLKAESKAIDKFISKNKLVILQDFPKEGQFKDNEFYKDPATGVYYNIIETGDTINYKLKVGDDVHVRFKGLRYFSTDNDSTEYDNMDPNRSPWPETFTYRGEVNLEARSLYSNTTSGWVAPLKHIGHTGRVKMIIPFTWGSQSDQQAYTPTYYDAVVYRMDSYIGENN